MGSEIYVCAKPQNSNELAIIYWASRSSEFYQIMQPYCSYGVIKPLTEKIIDDSIKEVKNKKEHYSQQISCEYRLIDVLENSTNSIEEKIYHFQSCMDSIDELTEAIDELELILQYFVFLSHSLSGGAQLYIGIDTEDTLEEQT